MKTKLSLLFLLSFVFYSGVAQVPQGFNYQAIARDGTGSILPNTALPVRLSIQSLSTGGTLFWKEIHSSINTNNIGLFTLVLGTGTRQTDSKALTFKEVDWKVTPKFLKTEIFYDGVWKDMGTTPLWSVPYAMVADSAAGLTTGAKISVRSDNDTDPDALFEVKRKDGQTVFAVYPEAVNIYVPRSGKGTKGGFAVGGFETTKKSPQDYFRVTPDSVRIYIDPTPSVKGTKGGFAVGGYETTKGINNMYFNLTGATNVNTVKGSPQILWYPNKNAFLAGNVHIGSIDSVGDYSTALGYQSIAMGKYSQAFGYRAKAFGDYSTSIGKNSVAGSKTPVANNAFAFGDAAKATGTDSYAFGTGALASGPRSFALGSSQKNDSTGVTVHTVASAEAAFALGYGSVASYLGAFAMGVLDTASGPLALAMGYFTRSQGAFSTTLGAGTTVEPAGWNGLATGFLTKAGNWAASSFGDQTYASGHTSFATGFKTTAGGQLSSTFGDQTKTSGYASTAFGYLTTAQSYGSMVLGRFNIISGSSASWNTYDPAFVIGNGTSATSRSNALTVYKNGNADLGGHLYLNNYIDLNRGATGIAMYVSDDEALWYDGTTFSWGFGGTYNVFANHVSIGTTATNSTYSLYVVGSALSTGTFYSSSDIRWKKNIAQLGSVLGKVILLNGVNYEWRNDEFPEIHFDSGTQIGLIAQDVEKVFPELVKTDNNGYKAVSYEKFTVILLEAMKEQQKQIESFKQENQQLKSELQSLKDRMDQIEAFIVKGGIK